MPFIIKNLTDGSLFWSNEDGWVDRGSATEFTAEEQNRTAFPPIDGEWVEIDNTSSTFTVEKHFLLPRYKHVTLKAGSPEEAARLALADHDPDGWESDYDEASPVAITGVWRGDKAYDSDAEAPGAQWGVPESGPVKLMTIWTLAIVNREGIDVTVHPNKASADAELYAYMKEWWAREVGDEPMPDDVDEAAKIYFEAAEEEDADTDDHGVTPPDFAAESLAPPLDAAELRTILDALRYRKSAAAAVNGEPLLSELEALCDKLAAKIEP
jgi:hypothetical protein